MRTDDTVCLRHLIGADMRIVVFTHIAPTTEYVLAMRAELVGGDIGEPVGRLTGFVTIATDDPTVRLASKPVDDVAARSHMPRTRPRPQCVQDLGERETGWHATILRGTEKRFVVTAKFPVAFPQRRPGFPTTAQQQHNLPTFVARHPSVTDLPSRSDKRRS